MRTGTWRSGMRTFFVLLFAVILIGCAWNARPISTAETPQDILSPSDSPATFLEDGRLARPKGYRRWIYVGAPLTPNELNGGRAAFPEFHNVYIDPTSYDSYKRTGAWRDGTVLLKELVSVGSKAASSGKGYFMGDVIGLEAAVKSREQFPGEPGNWGYFRFTDEEGGRPHRVAGALAREACSTCHQAAAEDDFVFTQYYPALREAKGYGAGNPEDR
ncbi:MAG: cytochrome P460 family protein [Planctomycetota bacterium]